MRLGDWICAGMATVGFAAAGFYLLANRPSDDVATNYPIAYEDSGRARTSEAKRRRPEVKALPDTDQLSGDPSAAVTLGGTRRESAATVRGTIESNVPVASSDSASERTSNDAGNESPDPKVGKTVLAPASAILAAVKSRYGADSQMQNVDDAIDALPIGFVAFNVPEKATVGKAIDIETKLSLRLQPTALKLEITQAGIVQTAELKVSDRMIANLEGAAFQINARNSAEQWIAQKKETTWSWSVTPKAGGVHVLVLTFDAVLVINGKEAKHTIETLRKRIEVDVGWPETWREWLELLKKTVESVSYLWAVLLVPIGGGIWRLWGRRTPSGGGPVDPSTGG